MKTLMALLLCAGSVSAASAQNSAGVNGEFSLQGRLTTTSGSPIGDGRHALALKVYVRGSAEVIYTETDEVTTSNGIFTTLVGDNGSGGATLKVDSRTEYDLGVAVDAEAEMSPRLRLGGVLRAAVAGDAGSVGGFTVDTTGTMARAVVTTDASGRLRTSLIGNSAVTSVNGLRGDVDIQITGSGVSTDTTGGVLHLNIGGGGGGGFTLPFASAPLTLGSGSAFSVTNTLAGTSGAFVNSGAGLALRAQATAGSAIHATSSGAVSGAATVRAENTAGAAVEAVGNTTTDAVVRIRNNAGAVGAKLISGLNAAGNATFEVAASGRTAINTAENNALEVTTTTAGNAAMKLNGGLVLNGPVGAGSIDLATGTSVVTNAYARANSVIMLTITSATGVTTAVPIRVSSQGSGTFSVAAVTNGLGSLAGTYSFNYLIINQ